MVRKIRSWPISLQKDRHKGILKHAEKRKILQLGGFRKALSNAWKPLIRKQGCQDADVAKVGWRGYVPKESKWEVQEANWNLKKKRKHAVSVTQRN